MNDNKDSKKALHVLLLEDSPNDADLICARLADFESAVTVDRSSNDKEFTAFLRGGSYDLVLADYHLPGYDALSALRLTKSIYPELPFICVSGTIGEEKAVELLKMGVTDYVMKSRLEKLPMAIRRTLAEVNDHQARKLAEEALKERERFLSGIIENIPNMIFVKDAKELRFLRVNKAGEELLGYSREELYRKNIYDLLPKEEAEKIMERDRAVLNSDKMMNITEEIIQTGNHGLRILHTKLISLKDEKGNPVYLLGISEDITERMKAETALRDNETRLQILINTIPDIIWLKDVNGVYILCNNMFEHFFGAKMAEIVGKTDFDFVPRELAESFRDHDRKAMAAGKSTSKEDWITFADDGRRVLMDTIKTPMVDASGKLIGVLGVGRDITVRKKAEEALRESEDKFSKAFQMAPFAISITRADNGKFIEVNEEFTNISGFTKSECLSKTALEMDMWADLEERNHIMEEIKTGRSVSGKEILLRNRNGKLINGLLSAQLLQISNTPCILSSIYDITERKKSEEEVRESKALIEAVLENVPLMIFLKEAAELRFVMFNRTGEELLGYDRKLLLGRNNLDLFPPEQAANFMSKDREVLESKEGFLDIPEEPILTAKHGERLLHTQKVCIRGEDGTTKFLLGISEDITERKKTEKYVKMGTDVLQILNEPLDAQESNRRIVSVLKTGTGFDAVGIRLQDGNDFPYFSQEGFSKDFLMTENSLAERTSDGGVCLDKDGKINLECTCGLVISGNTDPSKPLFTRGGSFWTNDSSPLLDIPPDKELRYHPRNRCIHDGYQSFALVPIRNKEKIVGLIQFNDKQKDRFTIETVQLLEGIATHIGEAMVRRRAEDALKTSEENLLRLNRDLEHRVRKELQNNREKDATLIKQSRSAAMGEMIHNIAHQWRQPLNNLGLLVQSLKDKYSDRVFPQDELEKFVTRSMNLVTHMSRTIDDFRNFFKPDKEAISFRIGDSVRQSVAIIEASYKNNSIELELVLDESIQITGYPNELAQVLLNILNNSKEAFSMRKTVRPKVTIRVRKVRDTIIVTVSDNGGGVPESEISKLFTPYYSTKEMGTGIGLYMSKMIIEKNMKGKMSVKNLNDGLEVRIDFGKRSG